MTRLAAIAVVGASLAAALAWSGWPRAATPSQPAWTEVAWPFPIDQWGKGKAFRCKAADCGAEVNILCLDARLKKASSSVRLSLCSER